MTHTVLALPVLLFTDEIATLIAIGLIINLVALAMFISAIVIISKTEPEQLTLSRAAWLLIVIFGGIIGQIIFFIAGRRKDTPTGYDQDPTGQDFDPYAQQDFDPYAQ